MPNPSSYRRLLGESAVVVAVVAVALGCRQLAHPWIGPGYPFVTVFPAVALLAWWRGAQVGIPAMVIGWASSTVLFVEPRGTLWHAHAGHLIAAGLFLLSSGLIVALGEHRLRGTAQLRIAAQVKARLAAIVESSQDAILSKTLDGVITSWNAAAERLFGYSPPEVVGQPITILIPPDHLHEEEEILRKIRQGEVISHFETVRTRKGGSRVHVSVTVSPIRDDQGEVIGASKIVRDISERKRLESRQRLMADELDHRVKNTLALVQSLATQTFTASKSFQEFRTAFTGRLQALAKTHVALARGKWEGIALRDIADSVLGPFVEGRDGRVRIDGPSVILPPRAVMPLTLTLHELTTNAVKHGALSRPDGRIELAWRANGSSTDIHWREHREGTSIAAGAPGSGITLMKGLVSYELGGTFDLRLETDGLRCTIGLPHFPRDSSTFSDME